MDTSRFRATNAILRTKTSTARQAATITAVGCNTSTYYLRLASAGEKIEIRSLQTLADATILIAGNITTAGGQQQGLLIKLDNAGNMLGQKRLLINGQPCTIHSAATLVQGDIIIGGTINNGLNQVFISRMAADFSISWMQYYTLAVNPLQVSVQLFENAFIALAIRIQDAVVCARLAIDGTMMHSTQVAIPNLMDLAGFNLSNGTLLLAANILEAGNHYTRLVETNANTGANTASTQMGNGTDETYYGAMNRFFLRANVLGISKTASGFSLTRNILYGSANTETQHTYQAPANIDWNSTVGMDNTARALGVCIPQDGKLFFLRHPAYYTTKVEYTKSYSVPVGAALKGVTACADGGFLFALNTSGGNEAILIKTDSVGTLAGCGSQEELNQSVEKILLPNSPRSITSATYQVVLSSMPGALFDANLTASFDCKQNFCPLVPNLDDCFTSYYKRYASHSFSDGFTRHFLLNNNNQLAITARQDRLTGDGAVESSGIKLFDEKGHFVKGVKYFSDGKSSSLQASKVDEHSVMLQSYDVYAGKPLYTFTLLSDNLDVIWSRSLITNSGFSAGGLTFGDMYKDQEGNYYFLQSQGGFGVVKGKVLVYKMDASGNEVWLKVYELPSGNAGPATMAITNTSLVIIMEGDAEGTVSIRLDKQTGNFLNAYRFAKGVGWGGSLYNRLSTFDNGHIFYAGNDKDYRFLMATFDTMGLPTKMRVVDEAGSAYRAGSVKNGFLYAAYYNWNGAGYTNVLMKIDTALDAVYKNEYPWDYGNPCGLSVSDNGSVYLAGNNIWGGDNGYYWDPYIIKFSSLGDRGDCNHIKGSLPLIDINPLPVSITMVPVSVSFQSGSKTVTLVPDDDGQQIKAIPCNNLAICSAIQVTGPDQICRQDMSYNFQADKNVTCRVLPQWTFDTAYATRIRNNTGELELQFKKTGSVWVEAKVDDGCHQVTDRKLVNIQSNGASLALGSDSSLCPGDSLLLNAGPGFNSYKWQDGSSGTDLMVKQAGKYFVETGNACGEHFFDTINIGAVHVPSIDITGDTLVCYDGPASLAVTDQFQTYRWVSGSGTPLSTGHTVSFKMLQDQEVKIMGATKEGCKARDSVLMQVKFARAIALGADTSFCTGDSIVLSAGKDYTSYQWNTGSANAVLVAKQAGTYSIAALDTNKCTARDTLIIAQLYPLDLVNLGRDRSYCQGQPIVLDAGEHTSYAWQDGSAGRRFTVNSTGRYKVVVTNNFGCVTADSIDILNEVVPPADFLVNRDSLCRYATLDLVPAGTYNNYLWSTGAMQRSITINQPGAYVLTVADKDGCSGSDTIYIYRKDCLAGVYIPNAFTPGSDRRNDVFRAMVYGEAIVFELQVYNRYGQLVFASNDPYKGWDGSVNGTPANSGTYVWQCRYHLKGGELTYRKGTVTVVR